MGKTPYEESVASCSKIIYDGFVDYNKAFHRITRRAQSRFEKCDWKGHQKDTSDRVFLYEKSVRRVVKALHREMDSRVSNYRYWNDIRDYFGDRLLNVPDSGFMKTFFNSVTRRIFNTVGVNPDLEFVTSSIEEGIEMFKSLNLRRYPYWKSLEKLFNAVLDDFHFRVPYSDKQECASMIAADVRDHFRDNTNVEINDILRFEFIYTFFYQAARAYLTGRIITRTGIQPIVIALKNNGDAIAVDAVLLDEDDVSIVFGYTRSYYFADPNSVIGAVHFLHSILPRKPIDELYTVLGRLRQGKTERYHAFTQHLEQSSDNFIHTEGERGLVMIVFTLPSYNLVFKIMRDSFGYPKTTTHDKVAEKYKLVSNHDRAGRLIDTQEFKNLKLPVNRFSGDLLDELITDASLTASLVNGDIMFNRIYIERRVKPLNMFLMSAHADEAKLIILDYGQCIKDLAQTNLFPGDLLPKNFGVTRHRRVIFYDYDEVALITNCNFRGLPEADDYLEEINMEPWFYVGANDIFPQEFTRFLAMDDNLKSLFQNVHGDLFRVDFWHDIKSRHLTGEVPVVVPYYHRTTRHNLIHGC